MTGIGDALYDGVRTANRSVRVVLLDVFWKAVWLGITTALLGSILIWFLFQLQSIEWEVPNIPGSSALLMTILLRAMWDAYAGTVFWAVVLALACSFLIWILLEAYFRSRWVRKVTEDSYLPEQSTPKGQAKTLTTRRFALPSPGGRGFAVFLTSNVATLLVSAGAAVSTGLIALGRYLHTPAGEWGALWDETRGAAVASLVAVAGLTFLLCVFKTAVRADAIDLLARNLFGLAGVVGTVVLFEVLVAAAFVVGLAALVAMVASVAGLIGVVIIAAVMAVAMAILNSYLLLVRFSAVGIMRHDAAGI